MEIITLGTFADFLRAMNVESRRDLLRSLNIYYGNFDGEARLLESSVYCLSSLRNAVAHNLIIFDCRFKDAEVASVVKSLVKQEIGEDFLEYRSLIDYLAIILIFLKKSGVSITERKKLIKSFRTECEQLRCAIPSNIYDKILGTDILSKLAIISKY